ncbi:PQQ-binding-like beta-propeller repeat protein [Microbacterium sp. SS28]|uniref:outer membrane protein assembly factor BamB family protein n=1 Tax=Microbacterium sp. SS28 TaxID=2919948 RepID=UPI001FA9C85C|nr:PQQ-binding-like beta-propeller repeat protein [Microbacterium sp. SS28]
MPGAGQVSRRRRRRIVPAAVLCGVVAVGTLALVAATDVRASTAGGAAAAFTPRDGTAGWSQMPGGVAQHEHRRAPGLSALFALPETAYEIAVGGYPADAVSVPHWGVYSGPEAGRAGGIPRELFSVGGDGIRQIAAIGFPTDSVFVPGLLVLPADVERGAEWSSEGDSVWAGLGADGMPFSALYAYSADSTAREPEDPALAPYAEDGCLETASTLTLTPDEGDDLIYRQTSLWCPGEGVVASTGAVDGFEPVTISHAEEPHVAIQLGGRVPSWQHPEHWDAAPVAARLADSVWGDTAFTTTPALNPVMVGSRLAVADANSADLNLFEEDAQGLFVARMLGPGGDVTAMGSQGEVLIVATSRRDLIAYTARGDRVWTRSTPDLVVTAPLAGGANCFVVAGLDGSVRLVDAATGEDRWVADVSADGLETLAVSGSLAVAGDRVGSLAAVDLTDGSVVWTGADDWKADALAADAESIFVARDDGIERLDPVTGATLWKTGVGTGLDDLAIVGDLVVAQTWEDLVAMSAEDGGIRWRAPRATAMTSDGTSLVAAGGSSIRLIGSDGTDAATWPVPAESLGSYRYLTAATNAVWMLDGKAGIVKVGR